MKKPVILAMVALVIVSATAAWASVEIEMVAYQQSTKDVCDVGASNDAAMTMTRKYDQLVRAMEREGIGFGRDGNFWGPTQPQQLLDYCHQSGDGGGGS